MPYEPIIPNGQHLGTSHDIAGAATGHLFEDGTNKLVGHAAWRWVDEPEPDYEPSYRPEAPRQLTPEEIELAVKLAGMIVAGIIRGAVVATPHIKRWWSSTAVPIGKSAWQAVTFRRKKRQLPGTTSSFVEEAMFVASSRGVEVAPANGEIRMSSAEWESRFRSMLYAGAFAQEQMRVLSIARVDEHQVALEAPSVTETLTSEQFIERVRIMIEANPALLNEKTSAELIKAFNPDRKLLDPL